MEQTLIDNASQIILAAALERIFFDVRPSVLSLVGGGIIVSAALYVALTKNTSNSKELEVEEDDTTQHQRGQRRVRWADETEVHEMEADPMLSQVEVEPGK